MIHVITLFGLLAMVFGASMIWRPRQWSEGIIRFSQHPAFHPFEVLARLLFGAGFVAAADRTAFPLLISGLGYLLLVVGLGLLCTPPAKHRQFALWSARRFVGYFRISGFVALLGGAFLVYAALGA